MTEQSVGMTFMEIFRRYVRSPEDLRTLVLAEKYNLLLTWDGSHLSIATDRQPPTLEDVRDFEAFEAYQNKPVHAFRAGSTSLPVIESHTATVSRLAFVESVDLSEAMVNTTDRTAKVRLIAAGLSQNGKQYSEAVLRKAAPLFEGVRAYRDHPTKADQRERPERSMRDITGWYTGVVYENGGLYATRHFSRTQAGQDAWALVEDIVNGHAPASLAGVSINAQGTGRSVRRDDGDVLIVESIEAVTSVDDVTQPAAGGAYLK